jgi:uncharacterized protein (DUF736 family)
MSKKIGSLWKNKKDNKTYLSGNLEVIAGQVMKILVFPNDKKGNEKAPDYNIVLSEPLKDNQKLKAGTAQPENF